MRVNSIGYDEKYVIYTYFELTRRVICVSNTKLDFLGWLQSAKVLTLMLLLIWR